MMRKFEDFTHLYALSKTLRFEARPVGATLDHIIADGLLEEDEHRASDYVEVKKIIDRYHKAFIDKVMDSFRLNVEDEGHSDSLSEYLSCYHSKSDNDAAREQFEKVQKNLRESIAKALTGAEAYKTIFKKELIKKDLLEWPELDNNEKRLVEKFSDFTTYFSNYHENRKSMYSEEEKSSTIAYRLINENLPKFIDNIEAFKKIAVIPEMQENLKALYKEIEEYLNVASIAEVFELTYYNMVLTQRQIDVYNLVIGGKSEEKVKIKGLNEYVNLYNQQHKDARLPKLRLLYKQILSDRNAISWLPEAFSSDQEVLMAIKSSYDSLRDHVLCDEGLKQLLSTLDRYDKKGIFITNDLALTDISQKLFHSWSVITNAVMDDIKSVLPRKKKKDDEAYEERARKKVKGESSFSIGYLDDCLEKAGKKESVEDYFAQLGAYETVTEQYPNLFIRIANAYTEVADLLSLDYPKTKNLAQDKDNVAKIKNLLDAIKDLQHFVKPLLGKGDESDKDEGFYGELAGLWAELDKMTPLYNMVRNYMTRKPYSQEKIRLYFENNGSVLNGWVDSKTEKSDNGTQYGGYLFRKKNAIGEYDYFVGISANTKLFRRKENVKAEGGYERLDYYQLKSQTIFGSSYGGNYGDDVKEFFSKAKVFLKTHAINVDLFPREETLPAYLKRIQHDSQSLYEEMLNDKFCAKAYNDILERLEATLASLNRVDAAVQLSERTDLSLAQLIEEIGKLPSKSFSYFPVSDEDVENAMNSDNKRLFLFQIMNKDLSYAETHTEGKRKSRGNDNLHTMYFKSLMAGGSGIIDIGTAQMFFRKKSDLGYSEEVMSKGHHYNQLKDKFSYPIISKKRYVYDKFLFHLSLALNYQQPNKYGDINQQVREYLQSSPDAHIIGIDRGERHLLYLVVIDQHGNIKEQCSLNEIVNEYNGNTYRIDYHALLDKREKERQQARGSWQTIESIKELKEGYLSQVVHKICQWMVKYHAIVVLEDLNQGFMRGRQKVEKSVYQKFEKMLIDKLNYMVDKKTDPVAPGGLLNAYQLTGKFESFRKLDKQSGFLFYIPAWNTSKIDPVTGFVNLLDTRYTNKDNARAFIGKFSAIRYNAEQDWLEFSFDYDRFTTKAQGTRTLWTLCTQGERIKTFRNPSKNNEWDNVSVDLTQEFKKLFADYGISLEGNLKEFILSQDDKTFFEQLLCLLKLTLQMRNSITGTQTDYLVSPVLSDNGVFFDSRTCSESLPANADANGAYNIARKGLMMVRQIQQTDDLSKLKFDLSNKAWLRFAQEKPYEHE